MKIIINPFDKYELITQKRADFELWREAFYLVQNKEHLTKDGLNKILAIRAQVNRGLPNNLKVAFPEIIYLDKPIVANSKIFNPNWLAGFTSAEGSFLVRVKKSNTNLSGFQVRLIFQLVQHYRDEALMLSVNKYLDCDHLKKDK